MTITYLSAKNLQGVAADTKPTNVDDGTIFYETDTYTFYDMVSGSWKERASRISPSKFIIYLSGSTVKAKNCSTGMVDFTHASDVGNVTNSCLGQMTSTGGTIDYTNDIFTINTPISITPTTNASLERYVFRGVPGYTRGTGTMFFVGSTFPDQDSMFKSIATVASLEGCYVEINGIGCTNVNFGRSSTGNNLQGGGTIIDAGFVNIEMDNSGPGFPVVIRDCWTQYMWRGIRLAGWIFWPIITNCAFTDHNLTFEGDYDIMLVRNGHDDFPKVCYMENLFTIHGAAGLSSVTGKMNNSIVLSGGYHLVNGIYIDGGRYTDSVMAFKQMFSSTINRVQLIDLSGHDGSINPNFQAPIVFDNNDPDDEVPFDNYACFNNNLRDMAIPLVTTATTAKSIKFLNSAFRNDIEIYGYFGNVPVIDDAGAGIENQITVIHGQLPSASTNTKITTSNSLVKIVDKRPGAFNRGLETASGDGSDTTFSWNHGCWTTPVNFYAYAITGDAMGAYTVTANSTQIIVTYPIAPPGGTDNLKFSWYASLYNN
jgi:hypothetical protein